MENVDQVIKKRFESKFLITPGCWIWKAGRHTKLPYGKFKIYGKTVLAHRFSYELYIGRICEGMFVLHRCDNPSCVNPCHLFIGTHDDNMSDKVAKNRQAKAERITGNRNSAKGERHGRALLTESDVAEIRKISATHHHYGRAELAKKYGVSEATIKAIKSGKLWNSTK